jgi:NADPH-dependent 2,4-dienoyl-CoA reductase/sulfur reductase-like enzyme
MKERVVIIGGVAAGMGAATQIRRKNPDIEIFVFEQSEFVSYGLCGMPFFISGIIKNYEDLIVYKPSYFKTNRNIDVFTKHRVEKIDIEKREVIVSNLEDGTEKNISWSKLLIATGARARKLNIEGSNLKNIFTFRDLNSAILLKNFINERKPKKCAIIGSGLIGLALAEAFVLNNIKTYVIEKEEKILPIFSNDMSEIVLKELQKNGVEVFTNSTVNAFIGKEEVEKISVNEKILDVDFVLLSIGVIPNIELAKSAGIEINSLGCIKVNNKMQTSVPGIYAAGDCTNSYSIITKKEIYLPLATITDKQAQVAGNNIAGDSEIYNGTVGSVVEKVFNLEVARTGLTENEIIKEGYNYKSIKIKGKSKAGYYPKAKDLYLKVFVDLNSKKILGAEMIGEEGVAKRIDIIGTAIYAGLKIDQLYDIDFAYSPPFSPSRDILWNLSAKFKEL